MTKVLAKEVAEFNVRTLMVLLAAFDTGMPAAVKAGQQPLANDYKGTVLDKTLQIMTKGQFVPGGDRHKAADAIYEVAVGTGVGEGKESEMFLPLGRDMGSRVKLVRDRLDHCWEVFGDVAMNVHHADEE